MRSRPSRGTSWPIKLIAAYAGAMVLTLGIVVGLSGPPGTWNSGIIHGQVVLREGNCMPIVGPSQCRVSPVSRTIFFREPASLGMMEGSYLREKTPLITTAKARHGFYEVALPVGVYSVFVEDAGGEYCNRWTAPPTPMGQGIMCRVLVTHGAPIQYDITINHASS